MRRICLVGAVVGLACAPPPAQINGDEDGSSTASPTSGATSSSGTEESSTGIASTSTTASSSSSGSSGDVESSSSSGEVLDGPGCEPPPACDRGEYVGSMRIESADQIADIAGYTSVSGWFEIVNSDLECLDFLGCLETVGHDVGIYDNAELKSLAGLDGLTAVGTYVDEGPDYGSIVLARNDALVELDGFGGITDLEQSLVISSHAALEEVTGFAMLETIAVDLSIHQNPLLVKLGPLKELLALGNACQITNNASLCLSQAFLVCGDLKQGGGFGSTENNDDSC